MSYAAAAELEFLVQGFATGHGDDEFDATAAEKFGFGFTNGSMAEINTPRTVRNEEEYQQQTVKISPLTQEFTPLISRSNHFLL